MSVPIVKQEIYDDKKSEYKRLLQPISLDVILKNLPEPNVGKDKFGYTGRMEDTFETGSVENVCSYSEARIYDDKKSEYKRLLQPISLDVILKNLPEPNVGKDKFGYTGVDIRDLDPEMIKNI
ncbi:unnamed protein product [Lepeophtheirus salmonis]|uniref:(salmon louse) hypothetical protein n=1 Tax=Lepeophtheirus salmonis TaxID=72036 RepID=A0A7R8CE86_LEPSM|nr:unnamed protein product [Lepeophtheirus salmonis]CAF2793513.1 unnamed protein product [Lepeophtheirus salmonis]